MLAEIATISAKPVVPFAEITNLRIPHYRKHLDLKIKTQAEAVRFINEAGIVLLFPGDNLPLPDLWSAINGMDRKLPKHHRDYALRKTWDWKDTIPSRKEAWYGKLVKGKPAFVSLKDLPAIYALSSNFGELDDYLEAYADGLMSKECKTIYEVLLAEGPLPTSALRKVTNMAGGGDNARKFERAITELQTDLKIVKSGISNSNRWKYCSIYDLLLRWAPNLAEESRQYNNRLAMRHLITRYLETSIAAPTYIFTKLFGWEASLVERVLKEMVEDETVREIRLLDGPGPTSRAKPNPDGAIWVTGRSFS